MENKYEDAIRRSITDELSSLISDEVSDQGLTEEETLDPYGEDLTIVQREKLMKKWKVFDYTKISEATIAAAKKMREVLKIEVDGGHPLLGATCMECSVGRYRPMPKDNNLKCSKCGVVVRGYIPLPALKNFHQDRAKTKFIYGGFGMGKTTGATNEDIDMALYVPGLKTLVGTSDLKQLSAVALLEFLTWIPNNLIANHNKTDNVITLVNGSIFYFRPLYDEEKIKSLTLGRAHVIEASAIKRSQQKKIFLQLQKRLRQKIYKVIPFSGDPEFQKAIEETRKTTTVLFEDGLYKMDIRQAVYESNPVDDFFLEEAMKAERLYAPDGKHHDYEEDRPPVEKRNRFYSTYTFPTWANAAHLPTGIIEEWKASLTEEEINIQIEGSLKVKKFGNAFKKIEFVKPFAIPRSWRRLYATDSGIGDSRTWFAIAIDPINLEYIVYGAIGESQWTINAHASLLINHKAKLPFGHMYKPIQADKQLFNTRDNDKGDGFTSNNKTYETLGLHLVKAASQKLLIEQGVSHVNNIAAEGMLKFMKPYHDEDLNQGITITKKMYDEIRNYRRKEDGTLPIRKGADGPDTLRYVTGPLPSNRDVLERSLHSSFSQNIETGAIIELGSQKKRSLFSGSVVFSSPFHKEKTQEQIEQDDFNKYSPFGI